MDPDRVGDLFRFVSGRSILGRLAVLSGFLTDDRLKEVLETRPEGPWVGERLVELGLLTEDQRADLVHQQAEIFRNDRGDPDGRSFGHYLLVEQLGEGQSGIVWKAWDTRLQRWVALKEARTDALFTRDRFLREARAAAKIRHPHLIQAHEVGRQEDRDFIVLTYVDGKPLDQIPLSFEKAAAVMADIAEAVQALHDAGVLHRDIKPQNILLDAAGHGWLADFGIARDRAAQSLTLEGTLLGTPVYMAPEQAIGKPDRVGEAADVYGLGSTLYHLLTARAPFQAENQLETLLGRLSKDSPAPPREINPAIPSDLDQIVRRALEKNPLDRYPTAIAMAQDLRRFLRGEPLWTKRPGAIVRALRSVRREPHRWGWALALAGLFIALGAAALASGQRARYQTAYQEGIELWMRGALPEASDRFEAAAHAAPDRPEPWLMKGRCLLRLRDPSGAEGAWTEALRRDPGYGPALLERGKAALGAYVRLRPPPSGRVSGGALRFGPADPERPQDKARRERGEEDLARARTARGLDPTELGFLEGALAYGKADYPEALRALEKYVQKNPWDPSGLSLYAAAAYLAGSFEVAERSLTRAIALEPRAIRYLARGDARFGLGRYAEASEDYARAGDDPSARCNLGVALQSLGRASEAIAEYTRALDLRPGFARAFNNRGTAKIALLDLPGAEKDFELALEANEFYAEAYHNLANVLLLEDKIPEALHQYDLSLGCDPEYVEAYVHRARARLKAGRLNEAVADLEQALKRDRDNPDTLLDLATALRLEGHGDRALEALRKALAAAPGPWPLRTRATRLLEEWAK